MLIIDMNIMYNRVFWTESSKKKSEEKNMIIMIRNLQRIYLRTSMI